MSAVDVAHTARNAAAAKEFLNRSMRGTFSLKLVLILTTTTIPSCFRPGIVLTLVASSSRMLAARLRLGGQMFSGSSMFTGTTLSRRDLGRIAAAALPVSLWAQGGRGRPIAKPNSRFAGVQIGLPRPP